MKKGSARTTKKRRARFSGPDNRKTGVGVLDEVIVRRGKETVIEIISGGKTAAQALELAVSAIIWAEHLVGAFESENCLPTPIACHPGCNFCCFNQVELTPPEALLLGHHVERHFSEEERLALAARLARAVEIKAGKSKQEIAQIRQELPCPFLAGGKCSVYPVRPLVCRAMHALDAGQCETAFTSQGLMRVQHYAHRHEFIRSVAQGLLDGCRAMGCQSVTLDLTGALRDFFAAPNPSEQWIQGQKVFQAGG
jgi:Fe-S-cluster containining protein